MSGPFLHKISLLLEELFTCIEIIGKYSKFKDFSLINNTYGYKHHINIFDKDLMVNVLTVRLTSLIKIMKFTEYNIQSQINFVLWISNYILRHFPAFIITLSLEKLIIWNKKWSERFFFTVGNRIMYKRHHQSFCTVDYWFSPSLNTGLRCTGYFVSELNFPWCLILRACMVLLWCF